MNGWWAEHHGRCVPGVMQLVGILLLLVLGTGCAHGKFSDALSPTCSRLRVFNRTPWVCRVEITPSAGEMLASMTRIETSLPAAEEFIVDLVPGTYRLRAKRLTAPFTEFSQTYEAGGGKDYEWPLLGRKDE